VRVTTDVTKPTTQRQRQRRRRRAGRGASRGRGRGCWARLRGRGRERRERRRGMHQRETCGGGGVVLGWKDVARRGPFGGLFALPLELGDVTFLFTAYCSKNCTHRAFVSVHKRGQTRPADAPGWPRPVRSGTGRSGGRHCRTQRPSRSGSTS
jgi:hypothetical protein